MGSVASGGLQPRLGIIPLAPELDSDRAFVRLSDYAVPVDYGDPNHWPLTAAPHDPTRNISKHGQFNQNI